MTTLHLRVCGEADVDQANISEWLSRLHGILADYMPDEICNADETGLFFGCCQINLCA